MKQRYKFYDKDFKEVPAESEHKYRDMEYGVDLKEKDIEICNYPVDVGNGQEIETSINITFEQITKLNELINPILQMGAKLINTKTFCFECYRCGKKEVHPEFPSLRGIPVCSCGNILFLNKKAVKDWNEKEEKKRGYY